MKPRKGECTAEIDAPPDRVFGVVTDLPNLPAWNDRMEAVVDAPRELGEGGEWIVAMNVMGKRFHSRSHVIELDRDERRFVYRSKRVDDNPSFTVWTWHVDPADGGRRSRVTLAWDLRPVTFVRKHLISRLRHRQISRTEAPASLAALAKAAASATSAAA